MDKYSKSITDNNLELFKELSQEPNLHIYDCLILAIKYNAINIIPYIFKTYQIDITLHNNKIFKYSCKKGDLRLLNYYHANNLIKNPECGLIILAKKGFIKCFKYLIEKYPNTPIHNSFNMAVIHGHINIVKYIIRNYPNIKLVGKLRLAIVNDKEYVVDILLPHIKCKLDHKLIYFSASCQSGNVNMVERFLDINLLNKIDINTLVIDILNNEYFDIFILITKYIKPNMRIVLENNEFSDDILNKIYNHYNIFNWKDIKLQLTTECSICQSNTSNIKTPCSHEFCKDCIEKWITTNLSCPYCRFQFIELIYQ
jgi:hypothetical protein